MRSRYIVTAFSGDFYSYTLTPNTHSRTHRRRVYSTGVHTLSLTDDRSICTARRARTHAFASHRHRAANTQNRAGGGEESTRAHATHTRARVIPTRGIAGPPPIARRNAARGWPAHLLAAGRIPAFPANGASRYVERRRDDYLTNNAYNTVNRPPPRRSCVILFSLTTIHNVFTFCTTSVRPARA